MKNGATPDTNNLTYWENGNICWATLVDTKTKYLFDTVKKITKAGFDNSSTQLLPINTVIFSSRATIGEVCINKIPTTTNQGYKNFICNESRLNYEYLYYILKYVAKDIERLISAGTEYKEINSEQIKNYRIPVPPKDIQQSIVSECRKIDDDNSASHQAIENAKKEIERKVEKVLGTAPRQKVKNIININSETFNPTAFPGKEFTYIDIDSIEKGEGKINFDKKIVGHTAPSRARRIAKVGNTIISTVRPYLKGFAFISETKSDIIFSTGFVILEPNSSKTILEKVVYYAFMYSKDVMKQMIDAMPKGSYPSINTTDIENFVIGTPSIDIQQKLVEEIEILEARIATAQHEIAEAPAKKQAVLKKWLE